MKNRKSKIFLLLMGILLFLDGVWELISSGCSVYAGYAVSEYVGSAARAATLSGLGVFIGAAVAIGAGTMAIMDSGRNGVAKGSIAFGIIVVLISLPAVIVSWWHGYEINPVSCTNGIIIPVLFLIASIIKK